MWVSSRLKPFTRFPAYADFSFAEFNIEVTPNHTTPIIFIWERNEESLFKRLTDGMENEMVIIDERVDNFYTQCFGSNIPLDQYSYTLSCLNSQHGDELETYKVRLENLYSETDVKE